MSDLVDGDVGRYVLERSHPVRVLEALRRILEPLEALPIDGVDLGVRRPDLGRLGIVRMSFRADLVQAIVILIARLAATNSTHQLHELACVKIQIMCLRSCVGPMATHWSISTQERTLRRADAVARPQMDIHKFRRAPRHGLEGVAPVRKINLFRVRVLRDMLRVKKPVV